jgi:hypothetical protein
MESIAQIIDLHKTEFLSTIVFVRALDRFGTRSESLEYCQLGSVLILYRIFVCQKPFLRLEMN